MKINKTIGIISIMFILFININMSIFAGPFGLEMGITLEKIKEITGVEPKNENNNLFSITPPKPHSSFETYVIRVNKKNEVYYIKAIGKDIETSVYGTELKSAFTSIATSLEKTYGKYKIYDFIKYESIWDEPKDFMMGMLKKERFLMASWNKDEGSRVPDDIQDISLAAYPLNTTKGYLSIDYSFINMEEAENEKQNAEDSVF